MSAVLRGLALLACLAGAALSALLALTLSGLAPGLRSGLFDHAALEARCASQTAACNTDDFVRLAAHAPLDARALAGRMAERFEAGEIAAARDLAVHVLRRDTRSNLARFILAVEALEAGDFDRYLRLYLPQFRIDPRRESAELFAGVLAGLSRDPEMFRLIERDILENRPAWGQHYLRALAAEEGVPLKSKISLFSEYPAAQPVLLNLLVQKGEWASAYALFSEWIASGALGRDDTTPPLTAPYNPSLARTEAPLPFNWRLNTRAGEYLERGGVYVFFEGRRPATFLSQVFPMAPGDWRLRMRMSGQVSETGGWFRWRLACADGSGEPLSFDVKVLGAATSEQAFEVSRPTGACEFVTLSLVGVPGMFPQPARIEIEDVFLDRPQPEEGLE